MAGDSGSIGQDEIEKLLAESRAAAPTQASRQPSSAQAEIDSLLQQHGVSGPKQSAAPAPVPPSAGIAGGDIDLLFRQAEQALASINSAVPVPPEVTPYKLVDFQGAPPSTDNATLELLRDVELDLKIELGRTHMQLEEVLRLNKGAVVPLDRLAGDPVDIYVNGRLIARGEVLIMNDNFCVRVAELVAGEQAVA
jgi:flagellar motor switch protein FliN/FliY